MYELFPHSLSSLYWPFPRYSRTISLSLAFSLDLSELLNTISPTANSFEGRFGLRCVAALLDRCFLIMSCCENFSGAPDVMSLLVHSSDADMPVQRSLAFSAEIALDSSSSEICSCGFDTKYGVLDFSVGFLGHGVAVFVLGVAEVDCYAYVCE